MDQVTDLNDDESRKKSNFEMEKNRKIQTRKGDEIEVLCVCEFSQKVEGNIKQVVVCAPTYSLERNVHFNHRHYLRTTSG
jgi:hypothetical protein